MRDGRHGGRILYLEQALYLLPSFVPILGTIVSFATMPFAFLVVAAAYRQATTLLPAEIGAATAFEGE